MFNILFYCCFIFQCSSNLMGVQRFKYSKDFIATVSNSSIVGGPPAGMHLVKTSKIN